MGFYITRDLKGELLPARGKADVLVLDPEIKEITGREFHPRMVCVVDNGDFDAAGFCYSKQEFQRFSRPDGRPRRWFQLPRQWILNNFDPDTITDLLERGAEI